VLALTPSPTNPLAIGPAKFPDKRPLIPSNFQSLTRLIALMIALGHLPPGLAQEVLDQTKTVTFIEENDSFLPTFSDKHYTQGARLSFASGETTTGPRVSIADSVLFPGKNTEDRSTYRHSVYVGQSIFTPENLSRATPDPNDRPYAGWLYVGATLYRESQETLDRAEITVGMVGPAAGGGVVQNDWHSLAHDFLRGGKAQGWSAQLHNEPGFVVSEERKWRFPAMIAGLEADLLPEVNASIGNIFTYGAVGILARLGQQISVDWGPPRVQPAISGTDFINRQRLNGHWFAWYVFAGTEVRLVARNIFLDGNSFENSASVPKEPFVADITAGITAVSSIGRATLSYVRRTDEFKTQNGQDQFLSLSLALSF